MEVIKNVELKFEHGKIIVETDVKSLVIPMLEKLKEDVDAGKIDPIKGTDFDKIAIDQVIELIEKQLA